MVDVKVKIEPPGAHATIALNARKSLDGNVMIFDHDIMDIVIMPVKKKVVVSHNNPLIHPKTPSVFVQPC